MAKKNPKISVEEVEFECNVCLEVPKFSPIFQCQEGHIFCNVCHPKLRQQCPVCGKGNLGNIKCLIAQKILKTTAATSDSSSLSFSSHLDALVQQDIGSSYDHEQISLQEAMDSIHMGGPLPPGWEETRTAEGQLYYMNHITKTTQWEDPRAQIMQQRNIEQQQIQPSQQQMESARLGPLPPGWEQGETQEGEIYFINHHEKKTSWFDPRVPIGKLIIRRISMW